MFVQDPFEVRSIIRVLAACQQLRELCCVYEPLEKGDFLEAGDFQTLPLLQGLDEIRGLQQCVGRSGIEPGRASPEAFDMKQSIVEVLTIEIGYFQLAPRRGTK